MNGFAVAAPHSGSGKTIVTLGLLRALKDKGVPVAPAKAGPDYIDPAFHQAASGESCINLDPWAMRPDLLRTLARDHGERRLLVVEAMMGLFDGAADGTGSAADLTALLGLPVVFVVDASRMAQSVAALVGGYRGHRSDVRFAGVVLNRMGSTRHEAMLRKALEPTGVPVLGVVPHDATLAVPERHLGLVQADEHDGLETMVSAAATRIAECCDLEAIAVLKGKPEGNPEAPSRLPPLGQHMAIASDIAFAFAYPHLLDGWRAQGAELSFFSPLADEAPPKGADAVFLPGGYPELHSAKLAAAHHFRAGMENVLDRGATIYGECGGYMVLGERVIDAEGASHKMLGLLPVETSFAERKRHLGYRRLSPQPGAPWAMPLTAHEFHYSTIVREGAGDALYSAQDALGADLGSQGLRIGAICGSWQHVIDRADG